MNKFILEMEDLVVSNKDFRKANKSREKEFSLYIKGVVVGMTRSALTDAFTTFGTVKHLDVVMAKKCAFVEFETEEAYQQVLMQQEIIIPKLGTVYVEERKIKARNQKFKATEVPTPITPITPITPAEVPTPITPITRNEIGFSLYVKGVVDGMTRSALTDAFTKFGTVKNVDVVMAKKCAFVEFETEEAYQQALMQQEIVIPKLGTVYVEERKIKARNQKFKAIEAPTPITSITPITPTEVPTPITSITRNEIGFSLYVKGVVDGMNGKVLTSAFTKFGTVKNVDVVMSKSCAFVEFATNEAYQQALTQKVIDIHDLGTVSVEERKPKNNRNRYRQKKFNY